MYSLKKKVDPCVVELFASTCIFNSFEAETQFPASNDEKYLYL